MSKLVWDKSDERIYETGVSKGVLYSYDTTKKEYSTGVAWNGLTAFTKSPSGAEASPLYADNIKYLNLISAEDFGATIEAYTYPDEFGECNGEKTLATGISAGQQARKMFGLSVQTKVGNEDDSEAGYKIHLVYGAKAAASESAYSTVNDSPDAITFSWEISTTPVEIPGFKPSACITIDSTKADAAKLKTLEDILYGTEEKEPRLPLPSELINIFNATEDHPQG